MTCDNTTMHLLKANDFVAESRDINPDIKILEVSSTQQTGMDAWCDWLLPKLSEIQNVQPVADI